MTDTLEALTVQRVAERVTYTPRMVRQLAREGRFPAPIDASLPVRQWRWSSVAVAAYVEGRWSAS